MQIQQSVFEEIDKLLQTEIRLVNPPTGRDVKLLLAYPDVYENGVGNLAISTLYRKLTERGDCLVDRTYSPQDITKKKLQAQRLPYFGWETRKPFTDFDIIAFSISFEELEVLAIEMMELGRIPVKSTERRPSDPLVIAGGTTVNYNPEPLADFFDLFFIGDCEEGINEIVDSYKSNEDRSRTALLQRLATVDGVYVPSFYDVDYDTEGYVTRWHKNYDAAPDVVHRRVYHNFAKDPSYSVFINKNSIYHELSFSLEFARGCIYACNFCQYGMMNRNPRWMEIEDGCQLIVEKALPFTNNIKLFYEAMTHEYLDHFLEHLEPIVDRHNLEIRLGAFTNNQVTDTIIRVAAKGGQRCITVAPEAAAGTMRKIAGKDGFYKDDGVLATARLSAKYGIKDFGLYLLIGLPGETDRDILDLADLIARVRSEMISSGSRHGVLEVHVNPVFLKPLTALQWAEMENPYESMRKLRLLISHLSNRYQFDVLLDAKSKAEIGAGYLGPAQRFGGHDIVIKTVVGTKMNWSQPILARGDRRIGEVMWRASKMGNNAEAWSKALLETGLDEQLYFRSKDLTRRLPWFFLDSNVKHSVLRARWQQLQGVISLSRQDRTEVYA